jgi:hypothetical protein
MNIYIAIIPSANAGYVKSGRINPEKEPCESIKKIGWKITKKATKYENFLWNLMILSRPMYLFQKRAVSPENISKVNNTKPVIPNSLPIEYKSIDRVIVCSIGILYTFLVLKKAQMCYI